MDFLSSQQVSSNIIGSIRFDLFVSVAGSEKRCLFLTDNFTIQAEKKIALILPDSCSSRELKKSSVYFKNTHFQLIETSGSGKEFFSYLKNFFDQNQRDQIKILVDYSCITNTLLANIIQVIQELERNNLVINMYFVYTPVSCSKPYKFIPKRNTTLDLIPEKLQNNKPVALIMGLGTVQNSADYVMQRLKPDITVLMYSDPALTKDFLECIFKVNDEVISAVQTGNLVSYPIKDPEILYQELTARCVELRISHNVVIVPLGPKIFMLNAYLLASRYPDIHVYNLNMKPRQRLFSSRSGHEILIQKATFINEDY